MSAASPSIAAPPVGRVAAGLPAAVPFVAPEVIERRRGTPFALRLGANENALGPSPRALAAAEAALVRAAWYADPESFELRERLAGEGVAPRARIVVGSGIDDLLGLAVRSVLDPGEVAVAAAGTYATFGYHVRVQGAELRTVPYTDTFAIDLGALAAAATREGARVVYLANPDNPSGGRQGEAAIRELALALPPGCALFLDEAYADFAPPSAAGLAGLETVLRFRTFSKGHGLAGLRIGYLFGAAPYTEACNRMRVQFGVNRVAQAAALAALEDADHLAWVVAQTALERSRYAALGAEVGWRPLPSQTNFVAFDTGDPVLAAAWGAALEGRGVFVRRGTVPPLDRCLRVTVGTGEQRARLASVLAELAPQVQRRTGGRDGAD